MGRGSYQSDLQRARGLCYFSVYGTTVLLNEDAEVI